MISTLWQSNAFLTDHCQQVTSNCWLKTPRFATTEPETIRPVLTQRTKILWHSGLTYVWMYWYRYLYDNWAINCTSVGLDSIYQFHVPPDASPNPQLGSLDHSGSAIPQMPHSLYPRVDPSTGTMHTSIILYFFRQGTQYNVTSISWWHSHVIHQTLQEHC